MKSFLRRRNNHTLSLLNVMGGGAAFTYDFFIDFNTNDTTPLTSPYAGELGSVTPVEVDGTLTATGGRLVNTSQGTPADGDLGVRSTTAFSRVNGRAVIFDFTPSVINVYPLLFWSIAASVNGVNGEASLRLEAALGTNDTGLVSLVTPLVVGVKYTFALVLRSTGAFLFAYGGTFSNPTLVWVRTSGSTASLYAAISYFSGTGELSNIRSLVLGAPFSTDFGIATFTDTSLISGDVFTGVADASHDYEFTLPGTPAANDEIAIRYRRTDDNNCWKLYLKRNAGNTAWDLLLDSVSGGTVVNRITVAGVGTPDMLRAVSDGNLHNCYTRAGTAWTKRGGEINNSLHVAGLGMSIAAAAGTTLTRVTDWPRRSFEYPNG